MRGASCLSSSASPSAIPRNRSNAVGATPVSPVTGRSRDDQEDSNGNQGLGSKAEASRGVGEEVRRHPSRAQEAEELCRAGQPPARQLADAVAPAMSAHRPQPREPAQVQDLPHHAPGARARRKDPGIEESKLVVIRSMGVSPMPQDMGETPMLRGED